LPGYATLGLLAPAALTLLRMVKGLSVGGEYTSSMVFLVERAPEGRRGLMGALTACGAGAGILLGSAVGAVLAASISTAALESWGWRIPFLLGFIVGIAGYFLRRHILETAPVGRRKRPPIVETLHDHWRIVIGFAGLSAFIAVGFYVSFVYLVSWQPSALLAQFGQLGLALIIGLYGGTLPAFLVEAAPPQVRCTAVSLGYNICLGVIGG
jgi:MHS family proline/betaine transporter-like MFS transporter